MFKFRKKYAVLILAMLGFIPIKTHAFVLVPIATINVTEKSSDDNSSYNFHYSVVSAVSPIEYDKGNFDIQTQQGTGEYLLNATVGAGAYVYLTQDTGKDSKLASVECESSNNQVTVSNITDGVKILAYPFSLINCTFTNKQADFRPDPLIVIPGLLGSAQKNGEWLIDPIFHTYDNLLDTLRLNGYVDGQNLFTFPYDWRQSNATSSIELMGKISGVKQICKCDKVDIVAHSMGGLVARSYIQSDKYRQDVDQLIFIGTPHLGSAPAYLAFEAGEGTGNFASLAGKYLLNKEAKKAGYSSLFEYINKKPLSSFSELLPVYDYLKNVSSTTLMKYPEGYPRNVFLEKLNSNLSSLNNSGVKIANISGSYGTTTMNVIRIVKSNILPLWKDGMPEKFYDLENGDRGLEFDAGDGTVTTTSASYISNDTTVLNSDHLGLPTIAETIVYKKLTNKEATSTVNKSQIKRILSVKIFSPADIVVVAPDGRRVGKNFATGTEVNDIEGSFYSGFETDDEYITIPDPMNGEYKVMAEGTGSGGEYTIVGGIISENNSVESSFSGTITPNMIVPIDINIDTVKDKIELTPQDREAPNINISSPVSRDYIRGERIDVLAISTDSGSGLLSQKTYFDTGVISTSSIDSFYEHLGEHKISVQSQDYVGNVSSSTVNFRITATASSTINDVEKLFKQGNIKKIGIKNDIISELKKVVRIERKIEYVQEKHPNEPVILKRIEKMTERIDKILCKELLKRIKKDYRKYMDDKAFQILVEDINWLINN